MSRLTNNMARKITRKGIVKKLDKIVSQIVIKRDKVCVTCGSTNQLGCGHLLSRIAYSTRWDLDNCYAQCWPCNYRHEFDPFPLMNYAIGKMGNKMVQELHRRYVTPHKYKTFELELLYENLKKTYDKK